MIGDKLTYHSTFKSITRYVISELNDKLIDENRICISVGGESGCGKTTLAYALLKDIETETGLKGFIFHLDDYFKLPPADNYNARLNDISLTGINEVNLELLNSHLVQFKRKNNILNKPLVNFGQNEILNELVSSDEFDFCIVEGTYVSTLKAPDYRIFIETNYLDTKKSRIERGRDHINEFNEQILEIEHHIIKLHYRLADIIIDKELNIIAKN